MFAVVYVGGAIAYVGWLIFSHHLTPRRVAAVTVALVAAVLLAARLSS